MSDSERSELGRLVMAKGDDMKTKDIVINYLRNHGYDGLCHRETECGCGLDDFAPCGDGPYHDCETAKARKLKDDEYIGDGGPGDAAYFAAP